MHDLEDAIAAGQIVKCKPWGKDQGAFVLVSARDFDPDFHVRADAPQAIGGSLPRAKRKKATD